MTKIRKNERTKIMNVEQLKSETESFLNKKLTTVKCGNMTFSVTGMCVAVTAALVIVHVMIGKCICSKMHSLKSRIKSYEAQGQIKQ